MALQNVTRLKSYLELPCDLGLCVLECCSFLKLVHLLLALHARFGFMESGHFKSLVWIQRHTCRVIGVAYIASTTKFLPSQNIQTIYGLWVTVDDCWLGTCLQLILGSVSHPLIKHMRHVKPLYSRHPAFWPTSGLALSSTPHGLR